jgi:hypothetical protein
MISWRKFYCHPIASNQIFVLIYNLLIADFQQALSFLLAFHWVAQNKLLGPTNVCFAQAWLIQIGDVSSGLWVLLIGVHTFVYVVLQKSIPRRFFIAGVVSLWIFCLILTAVGPLIHRQDFFVPAGAWCWINSDYELERLYLHYVWIFLAQVGSICIYATIYIVLRNRLAEVASQQPSGSSKKDEIAEIDNLGVATTTTILTTASIDTFHDSRQRIAKAARYMVVYPVAYVALTLPLASGRVAAMAGRHVPVIYLTVAGSLIGSCGVIDVILYISMRKGLVKSVLGLKSEKILGSPGADLQAGRRETLEAARIEGLDAQDMEIGAGSSQEIDGMTVASRSVTQNDDSCRTMIPEMSRSESMGSLADKEGA